MIIDALVAAFGETAGVIVAASIVLLVGIKLAREIAANKRRLRRLGIDVRIWPRR
jgi:hypothetical protein